MFDARVDRRQFLGSAALFGALAATPGWALARMNRGGWDKVQALLDDYVATKKLPGLVGAVARGTDDADFLMSGTLAVDSKRAVDADSLYRVYSMSKPITGMAAMMLIEDGKLRLDQSVGDFLPGFAKPMVIIDQMKSLDAKPASKPLTIRHLMTHSGGLGYIITSKGELLKEYARLGLTGGPVSNKPVPGLPKVTPPPSLQEFGKRISTLPLMYEPDTRWSYSAGLDVLGAVIEIASGMPFEAFLQKRLFGPLGMTSSWFVVPQSQLSRLTTNYGIVGGKLFPIDPPTDSAFADKSMIPLGGGGLVMSPRDYDRFLLMLAGKGKVGRTRVMKEETARLGMSNLLNPGVATENTYVTGQGFGAGGRVTLKDDPLGSGVGTFGWGGAAGTIAWVDPTRGIRASGYVQYMPGEALPFGKDFGKSVYTSL
ncbi:serine hydrolase [Sphingomonas sp. SUN039]|uniref:serine hydrolase domain-containing protein n=1 Tax=Sphingomonas sp. SUN039 TaxID=2937787 RepID=UPI00216425F5|nr:serine hydrolase domain-containing protein [Sphingomonas sp. SUN039]UVO52785.1 beta-lactamase family protein [Sphingomonas sp. SUN039]